MPDTLTLPAVSEIAFDKTNDSAASPKITKTPAYHIMTWGCQMNEEDSEQMALYLEQMGYREVKDAAHADVVLLNTCSVRAKPEEKVWSELGRLKDLKRDRPVLIIGVCGCMAQVESQEIQKRAPHVNLVVGTGNIAALPDLIQQVRENGRVVNEALLEQPKFKRTNTIALTALQLPPRKGAIVTDVPQRRTERAPKLKAHVPIMYGCDKFCTFCIVPFTRGRERSRPSVEILEEIEGLARKGARESSAGRPRPGGSGGRNWT